MAGFFRTRGWAAVGAPAPPVYLNSKARIQRFLGVSGNMVIERC